MTIHSEELESAIFDSPQKKKSAGEKEYLNSGPKKVIILALVENIPETPHNVDQMMGILGLEEFTYFVCGDMKIHNIVVGMSGHGGSCPCCYCEAQYDRKTGEWEKGARSRTFRTCRENAEKFEKADKKEKIPKNFKNNVRQPLIKGPLDTKILQVLPPAELHLCLGTGNKILFKANEEAGNDLVSKKVKFIFFKYAN